MINSKWVFIDLNCCRGFNNFFIKCLEEYGEKSDQYNKFGRKDYSDVYYIRTQIPELEPPFCLFFYDQDVKDLRRWMLNKFDDDNQNA